jgi:hypothetical protein
MLPSVMPHCYSLTDLGKRIGSSHSLGTLLPANSWR